MNKVTLTSPIWSNVAYLFVWFAPVAVELQVVVTLLGVASAVFHWGEYELKYKRNYHWLEWLQSWGYVAQRADMLLIYTTFMLIAAFASGLFQWAIIVWLFVLFADLIGFAHRFFLVALTGIIATVALLLAGAWVWVVAGLALFIVALWIREDAYTDPITRNNGWHSVWHHLSACGMICYTVGASIHLTGLI